MRELLLGLTVLAITALGAVLLLAFMAVVCFVLLVSGMVAADTLDIAQGYGILGGIAASALFIWLVNSWLDNTLPKQPLNLLHPQVQHHNKGIRP